MRYLLQMELNLNLRKLALDDAVDKLVVSSSVAKCAVLNGNGRKKNIFSTILQGLLKDGSDSEH